VVWIGSPKRRYIRWGRGMTVGPMPRINGIAVSGLRDSLVRPPAASRLPQPEL
jgi:hypothetical protein